MGDNLPPGVSAGHPHFNPPDMEHDHEWEPHDEMYPVFEDGAAIFVERCRWEHVLNAEPGYEGDMVVTESIPCDEQRTVRFEPVQVRHGDTDYTLVFERNEFEDSDGNLKPPVEQALHDVEVKQDEAEIIDCDPDPEAGHVTVVIGNFKLRYAPGTQTNREGSDD